MRKLNHKFPPQYFTHNPLKNTVDLFQWYSSAALLEYKMVLQTKNLILLLFLFYGCIPTKKTNPNLPYLIIKNINIVDVLKGEIVLNQDVVVKNKVIYFIGKSFLESVPPHSIYINGKGKYLTPSLWDMHFHLCWDAHNDTLLYPILLKNGITGIRDMGGDLSIMQNFKENLKKDEIMGLEIFGAGPMIDGNPPVHSDFSLPVDDKTNMIATLDSLKNKGADFFKIYSLIKESQLKDISIYCMKNKTHFAGHLSEYIEPEMSISLGQKSVEHLNRLDDIWQINKNRLDSIGHLMHLKKTFICPTLITYQLKTKVKDSTIINKAYNKYIPTALGIDHRRCSPSHRNDHESQTLVSLLLQQRLPIECHSYVC